MQQAYIEVFKSLRLYEGSSSVETWIYRICSRVCLAHMRQKYRKRFLFWSGPRLSEDAAADSRFDPYKECANREMRHQINAALQSLSPERKMIFVLFEVEGKSIEEISVILAKPEGTVKSNLFRARKDLERKLSGYVHS